MQRSGQEFVMAIREAEAIGAELILGEPQKVTKLC